MRKFFTCMLVTLFAALAVIQTGCRSCAGTQAGEPSQRSGRHISISGAFALYPVAVRWSEEFRKLHPEVKIDISAGGAGKGIADVLSGMVDIGMVSREVYEEEIRRGAVPVAVAKDAVVATVSSSNPAIDSILARGLTVAAGAGIWITGAAATWGDAFGTSGDAPIHVYTRSDACGAAEMWAMMFGKRQEDLAGVGVYGDPGLAQAVRRDALGIGFNNTGYAYDATTRRQVDGLRVVPLDLDANGRIDAGEDFYTTMDDIIAAIAEGKYPSPPARELYFVVKSAGGAAREFMEFVLTAGQQYVHEAGYIRLPAGQLREELDKLR